MPTKQNARSDQVWTDEEKAAMRESARERRKSKRLTPEEERAQGEADIQEKIAEMAPAEQAIAKRIHEIATAVPSLVPRTYYGMPAYAKDGKVICFFQPASKFKVRYSTFGFQPDATLDEGSMWPTSWAVTEITPEVADRIASLVRKAVG